MNRGRILTGMFCLLVFCWIFHPLELHAEIASDNAFEGVTWEKIIEDELEGPYGVVQSLCATEDYIICIENYADNPSEPDIIKAYYRNDTDGEGNPVEQYSLAKRVALTDYEHANGMAYNPNTGEIVVSLYTSLNPENRGCLFLMDAETLEYKSKIKISDHYNILGIGYDEFNDRYIIQTNVEGGYSFKILDSQFQIIEDLGEYAGTAKGDNFQDLCVSGDYIINFPLTLGMGIGDYINMYSISRKVLVSDSQLDFHFENVSADEPESVCELEPGVFLAAVNVVYTDGRRTICLYKTMVPYNFTAADVENQENVLLPEESVQKNEDRSAEDKLASDEKQSNTQKTTGKSVAKSFLKVVLILVLCMAAVLAVYGKIVSVQRERQRKLQRARRERARIRELYGE